MILLQNFGMEYYAISNQVILIIIDVLKNVYFIIWCQSPF